MRLTEQRHQNPSVSRYPGEILLSPLQSQAIHAPEKKKKFEALNINHTIYIVVIYQIMSLF